MGGRTAAKCGDAFVMHTHAAREGCECDLREPWCTYSIRPLSYVPSVPHNVFTAIRRAPLGCRRHRQCVPAPSPPARPPSASRPPSPPSAPPCSEPTPLRTPKRRYGR
eukprot:5260481-Prymnesium_polylepis.1